MADYGYDCIADAFKRQSPHFGFPCLLQNENHQIDFYYPFEVIRLQNEQNTPLGRYECLYTNMFTTVQHLDSLYKTKAAELFKYKIKEKRRIFESEEEGNFKKSHVENDNDNENYETIFSNFIEWLPEMFTFEFNVFNLMSVTEKSCIIERNRNKVALFINEKEEENGERDCIYKLLAMSKDFIVQELGVDKGKLLSIISFYRPLR